MIKTFTHRYTMPLVATIAAVACAPTKDAPVAAKSGSVVTSTRMLGTVEARLSVPQRMPKGASVAIDVDLYNRGDTTATLSAPGDYPFDVVVQAATGDTIWRFPPSGSIRPSIIRLTPAIAPGGSESYGTMRWEQTDSRGRPLPPGRYQVSVVLDAGGPWVGLSIGPVPVTIEP
jgi:hypothetical protein